MRAIIELELELECIGPNAKLAWLVLAQTCNQTRGDRIARLGVPKAAARCGMSQRTYRRAIAELERIGAIEPVGPRKGGRSASGVGYVGAYIVNPVSNIEAALNTPKKPKKPWPKGGIGATVNPSNGATVEAAPDEHVCEHLLSNAANGARVKGGKFDEQPSQKRSLTLAPLPANQEVLQEEQQEERQVLAQKPREARSPPKEKTPEELERQKRHQKARVDAALAAQAAAKAGTA